MTLTSFKKGVTNHLCAYISIIFNFAFSKLTYKLSTPVVALPQLLLINKPFQT